MPGSAVSVQELPFSCLLARTYTQMAPSQTSDASAVACSAGSQTRAFRGLVILATQQIQPCGSHLRLSREGCRRSYSMWDLGVCGVNQLHCLTRKAVPSCVLSAQEFCPSTAELSHCDLTAGRTALFLLLLCPGLDLHHFFWLRSSWSAQSLARSSCLITF